MCRRSHAGSYRGCQVSTVQYHAVPQKYYQVQACGQVSFISSSCFTAAFTTLSIFAESQLAMRSALLYVLVYLDIHEVKRTLLCSDKGKRILYGLAALNIDYMLSLRREVFAFTPISPSRTLSSDASLSSGTANSR